MERREQEGPGESDPSPDARLTGERGFADEDRRLRDDEVEERSELARHIQSRVFPAEPPALVNSAREMQAPQRLVDRLSQLPDETYQNIEAVWEALGGRAEPGRA